MSEIKSMPNVLAEVLPDFMRVPLEGRAISITTNPVRRDKISDAISKSMLKLVEWISHFKKDFHYNDAVDCWRQRGRFMFRTSKKVVTNFDDYYGRSDQDVYVFSPVESHQLRCKILSESGFYSRYFDFKLNWEENDFYKKILDDFFTQYIINGENNYGYYIYGSIGVGKSTLLSAIARVLITFLKINVRYVTMPRLTKLITSIDNTDRERVSDLENCDVLFVDDLLHENLTTNTQESHIRDFFAYRYGNGLVNIIAGNENIENQKDKNSFYRQMADYIGDSRYYKVIEINGNSRRV